MDRRVLVLCGLAIMLSLGGCASLKEASSGQVGCKPSEIEISDDETGWTARTWTATCRGRSYACAYVQTGSTYGKSSGTSGQVNCSPMSGSSTSRRNETAPPEPPTMVERPRPGDATSGGSMPSSNGDARSERAFDEERGVHIVRGSFALASGLHLRLIGIPQMAFGKVAAVVDGYSSEDAVQQCDALELLVNEEPFGSEENTRASEGTTINVESRFEFAIFKPLAQQYSTFGARACGRKWKLRESQMPELKKFFAVYAQIAQQVQDGDLKKKSDVPDP